MAMAPFPSFPEIGIEGSIKGRLQQCQGKLDIPSPSVPSPLVPARYSLFPVAYSLLFLLPDVCALLRQPHMRQHAIGKLPGHLF